MPMEYSQAAEDEVLDLQTLGALSVTVGGGTRVRLGSRKAEALLVYLALEGGRHPRDVLATLLWPESDQQHAGASLRVALSTLRKHLGDYVDVSRETVAIRPGAPVRLDLSDLEKKLARDDVEGALEMVRGQLLDGFHVRDSAQFEEWLRYQRDRVRREIVRALHGSVSRAIDASDYGKGLQAVRHLLELEPLDELAHRQCMLLLALSGRFTGALAQYEACREILRDELGVAPSEETQTLVERISAGEDASSLKPSPPPHNLQAVQTSFVGRGDELAQLGAWARDPGRRLITLLGTAGSGKTRLAREVASRLLSSFRDGVFFVSLEPLSSLDALIPAITNALGFDVDSFGSQLDQKTQLLHHLRPREMLLVLDGFEALVDGARLVSDILAAAPRVQMLVTSRQKLDLKGEWTLLVAGLPYSRSVEAAGSGEPEAVSLFIERACMTGLSRSQLEADPGHVDRICDLVEGLPLGIELAAAQASVLSLQEIGDEIQRGIDILTTSARDVPARHRSLRAAFERSWELLGEEERQALCRSSVFHGSFDRDAAQQVAGATLAQLSALLDASLLTRHQPGRFRMHGLLRQFAAEKLSQWPGVRDAVGDRHSRHYVDLLRSRQRGLMGEGMFRARDEIRRDAENVRAALEWATCHWGPEPAREAFTDVLSYYVVQGWQEGVDAFRRMAQLRREALAAQGTDDVSRDPLWLTARSHQGFLESNLGHIAESDTISRACVRPLREMGLQAELSECLHNLGVNASFRGDCDDALAYLEEAILLGRACEHTMWPTYLLWYGHVHFLLGAYEEGLLTLRKCHEIFGRRGTGWGQAFALSKMGLAADGLGDHAEALRYHQRALSVFESIGNHAGRGYCLSRMSMSAYFLQDYNQALELAEKGYFVFEEIDHRWGMCTSLCRLGFAFLALGDRSAAQLRFRRALRQAREDRMVPLSLYAMAGLACAMVTEGNEGAARRLFRYVRAHPQTPDIYLQLARDWIGDIETRRAGRATRAGVVEEAPETLEAIIERLLE